VTIRIEIWIRKSERAGSQSKFFDRDPTFSDFDPDRVAIRVRIENRIGTISTKSQSHEFDFFENTKKVKVLTLT
jgi:hypothetical protein